MALPRVPPLLPAGPEVILKPEPTGEFCEKCGKELVIKFGRYGKFIACSGYPACRNAKSASRSTAWYSTLFLGRYCGGVMLGSGFRRHA